MLLETSAGNSEGLFNREHGFSNMELKAEAGAGLASVAEWVPVILEALGSVPIPVEQNETTIKLARGICNMERD